MAALCELFDEFISQCARFPPLTRPKGNKTTHVEICIVHLPKGKKKFAVNYCTTQSFFFFLSFFAAAAAGAAGLAAGAGAGVFEGAAGVAAGAAGVVCAVAGAAGVVSAAGGGAAGVVSVSAVVLVSAVAGVGAAVAGVGAGAGAVSTAGAPPFSARRRLYATRCAPRSPTSSTLATYTGHCSMAGDTRPCRVKDN